MPWMRCSRQVIQECVSNQAWNSAISHAKASVSCESRNPPPASDHLKSLVRQVIMGPGSVAFNW